MITGAEDAAAAVARLSSSNRQVHARQYPQSAAYLNDKTPRAALGWTLWWTFLTVGAIANIVSPDPNDYEQGDIAAYIVVGVICLALAVYNLRNWRDRRRWKRALDMDG